MEEDDDLMVKYPRVVYSLRDKKVCGISCGGLHNAILTEQGCVYTWGCSDDGTLGRTGEESIPLLVDALKDEICISVACGDGQTMAVSTRGDVWGWGYGYLSIYP
jgi:regulator of chromosome condensation